MREMGDLIGAERAAAAGMVGPAEDARLVEGAIDDQLPTAFEKIGEARPALWAVKRVGFLYRHPRHLAAFGAQRVAGPRERLFLHEHLLTRGLPRLPRHDRRRVHFISVHASLLALSVQRTSQSCVDFSLQTSGVRVTSVAGFGTAAA